MSHARLDIQARDRAAIESLAGDWVALGPVLARQDTQHRTNAPVVRAQLRPQTPYIHTYTYTYIYTHTHMHTYTHAHIHTRTHTHTYTHTYTYIPTDMQMADGEQVCSRTELPRGTQTSVLHSLCGTPISVACYPVTHLFLGELERARHVFYPAHLQQRVRDR